jgi:microcystin-dependent protein
MKYRPFDDHERTLVHKYFSPRAAGDLPAPLIDAPPTMCLKINVDWIRHVYGVIDALDQDDAWNGNEETRNFARSEVRRLLASIYECTEMADNMGCTIGEIKMYFGDVPGGVLPMDGAWRARDDYPELWPELPAEYRFENVAPSFNYRGLFIDLPEGDYFRLPNMTKKFPVGAGEIGSSDVQPFNYYGGLVDETITAGDFGGEQEHLLTVPEMPPHGHVARRWSSGIATRNTYTSVSGQGNPEVNSTAPSTGDTGGGLPHNNMPPWVAVNYGIVYSCTVGEPIMTSFMLRQNPANDCQLEQSINNGASWTLAYDYSLCLPKQNNLEIIDRINDLTDLINGLIDIYDGTPESIDPVVVYGDENDALRDDALCFALYVYVLSVMEAAIEAYKQGFETSSGYLDGIGNILGGATGLITLFAGGVITPLAIGFAVGGLLFKSAAILDPLFDDIFGNAPEVNTDAVEAVACCMFSNLVGATVTQAAFGNSLFGCSWPEDEEIQLVADTVALTLIDTPSYLAFLKYLADIIPAAIDGVVLPCPCSQEICEHFDLEAPALPPNVTPFTGNIFVANTGVRASDPETGNSAAVWDSPIGAVLIRSVEYEFNNSGQPNQSRILTIWNGENVVYNDGVDPGPGVDEGRRSQAWNNVDVIGDRVRVTLESSTGEFVSWIYNFDICYTT